MTDCLCLGPVVRRDLSLSFFHCVSGSVKRDMPPRRGRLLLLLMGGHEETDPHTQLGHMRLQHMAG